MRACLSSQHALAGSTATGIQQVLDGSHDEAHAFYRRGTVRKAVRARLLAVVRAV